MKIVLDEVVKEYQKVIERRLENGEKLTAEKLIEISVFMFNALKVEGIPVHPDSDMLLFQYGVYDWGDQFGRHFSLDVTRQFTTEDEDEPYQLGFTLIYEPDKFNSCTAFNCWSFQFPRLEDWADHLKTTQGFMLTKEAVAKTYRLTFEQC